MSLTNFRSILIVASCVVGTRNFLFFGGWDKLTFIWSLSWVLFLRTTWPIFLYFSTNESVWSLSFFHPDLQEDLTRENKNKKSIPGTYRGIDQKVAIERLSLVLFFNVP